MRSLQKFAALHGSIHNHFNQERTRISRRNFAPRTFGSRIDAPPRWLHGASFARNDRCWVRAISETVLVFLTAPTVPLWAPVTGPGSEPIDRKTACGWDGGRDFFRRTDSAGQSRHSARNATSQKIRLSDIDMLTGQLRVLAVEQGRDQTLRRSLTTSMQPSAAYGKWVKHTARQTILGGSI